MRADTDSVSWAIRRHPLSLAKAALQTRDRHVVLLLTDSTVILQLTNRGLDHVTRGIANEPVQSLGEAILGRVLGAGLTGLLDHGIAYRLSALREARAEGSRLVLEDREGHYVFGSTEVNGRRVLDDFAPVETERFARAVNRAIQKQP